MGNNDVYQALGNQKEKYNCRIHDLSDFDSFRGNWRRVYVCCPQEGNMEWKTEAALMCCRFAIGHQCIPVAPQLYYARFMNDFDYRERRLVMKFSRLDLQRCDEVWAFGDCITESMEKELAYAAKRGKHISWFTTTEISEIMTDGEEACNE